MKFYDNSSIMVRTDQSGANRIRGRSFLLQHENRLSGGAT
jgi:hypothetical protein